MARLARSNRSARLAGILLGSLVLVGWVHARVGATTWRVERDGTADFTTIADAMNAAAVGDTILLGPGRYTEFAPFTTSGWTEDTYAAVTVDSLTLMGVDRDAVIIGPTESDFVGLGPKGVATSDQLTYFILKSVTVENTHDGAYLLGEAVIQDCRFVGCELGAVAVTTSGLVLQRTDFLNNSFEGLFADTGSGSIVIENCVFRDNLVLGAGIARSQSVAISPNPAKRA